MPGRDGGSPCCRPAPYPHRALSPAARKRVGEGASWRNHPGEGSGHAIPRSPLPDAPSLSLPRCAGEGSTRKDAGGKRRLGGTGRRTWTTNAGGRARNAPTPATRPLSRNAGEGWGGGVLAQPPRRRIGTRDTAKPAPGLPLPLPPPLRGRGEHPAGRGRGKALDCKSRRERAERTHTRTAPPLPQRGGGLGRGRPGAITPAKDRHTRYGETRSRPAPSLSLPRCAGEGSARLGRGQEEAVGKRPLGASGGARTWPARWVATR